MCGKENLKAVVVPAVGCDRGAMGPFSEIPDLWAKTLRQFLERNTFVPNDLQVVVCFSDRNANHHRYGDNRYTTLPPLIWPPWEGC